MTRPKNGARMSTGLIALLDDVAAIAKLAAASLDDVGVKAAKVGGKAAGIVIDDAAVTPRYVVGFAAERELPIIWRIAAGSMFNKIVILLPAALLLSVIAPWIITPLLMLGGVYLCIEGYHKVADYLKPSKATKALIDAGEGADAAALEKARVASAIRTDFILSAEIMAIALATVADETLWLKGVILAFVGVVMTIAVYGAVALIVKADDWGAALAQSAGRAWRALGRMIVRGMPKFLAALSFVGMIAMLWVGGGILIHGLYEFGLKAPELWIKGVSAAIGAAIPAVGGVFGWSFGAGVAATLGLLVGAATDPLAKSAASLAGGLIGKRGQRKSV
jgi:hypothetical protein